MATAGPSTTERDPNLTTRGRPRKKRVRTVTGCLVCRQRRVKCDERKVSRKSWPRRPRGTGADHQPRCSNCSRHPNRVCEYPFAAESVSEAGAAGGEGEHEDGDEDGVLPIIRSSAMPVGDEPYLSPAYRELLLAHAAAALMEAQRVDADLLKCVS